MGLHFGRSWAESMFTGHGVLLHVGKLDKLSPIISPEAAFLRSEGSKFETEKNKTYQTFVICSSYHLLKATLTATTIREHLWSHWTHERLLMCLETVFTAASMSSHCKQLDILLALSMHRTLQNSVCSRACGLGVASHLPNQSEFHHEMWMCNENLILVKDVDPQLQCNHKSQNILY